METKSIIRNKPIKALIVDDEESIIDLLSEILRKIGLNTIISAYSGKSALMLFLDEKPDIVLCDYLMPEINGIMLLKAIKALDSEVPVVLFTGYYKELMKKLEQEEIKPDYILRKPFIRLEKIVEIFQQCFPKYEFEII